MTMATDSNKDRSKPRIFVQIASYRDPECQWTVKDLFAKAAHPDRIFVGICWQYDPEEDADCFRIVTRPEQVRIAPFHWKESRGVCWARNITQQLWEGEEYTLVIDSHMRFAPDWDEKMIAELGMCDSGKPVISCHPASYTPPDKLEPNPKSTIQRAHLYDEYGDMRFKGEFLDRVPDKPLNGAFVAAGFMFSRADIIREVPYDPYLYFNQEEVSLSARFYTHGWDVFSSRQQHLYHYYNQKTNDKKRPLHWEDNQEWVVMQRYSRMRFNHLMGYEKTTDETALKELDKYGHGTARTLQQYEEYCGIDFKTRTLSERALRCLFIRDLEKWKDNRIYIPELDAPKAQPEPHPPLSDVVAKSIRQVVENSYAPKNRTIGSLLMFSGGLDSTALLKNLLTETDHRLHVHHIEICNSENRAAVENDSIEDIIEYCRKNYRPFEYSTSKSVFPLGMGGGLDLTLQLFTATRVYTALGGGIDLVWTGHIRPGINEIVEGAAVMHSAFATRNHVPEWMMPLRNLTKTDIYESMPHDLANLCWSCRTPVFDGNNYENCGKCHACEGLEEIQKAISKKTGKEPFSLPMKRVLRTPISEYHGVHEPQTSAITTATTTVAPKKSARIFSVIDPKKRGALPLDQQLLSNGEIRQLQLRRDVPQGIMVIENYLEPEICKTIMDFADNSVFTKLKVVDHEKSDKERVETMESEGRVTDHVDIDGMAGEILSIFNDAYCNRLANFYDVEFEWYERPQILRYPPGGKYNRHADADHWLADEKKWVRTQDRDYSVLLYLNENYEGGSLYFPNQNFRFKPKAGMLAAFPSGHEFLHEAEPTTSGIRYVIVSWSAIIGTPRVRNKPPYASVFIRQKRSSSRG